jgi:hypothetical protein
MCSAVIRHLQLENNTLICAQLILIYLSYRWVGVLYIYMCWADLPDLQLEYYRGGSRGGGTRRAPPKIGKNMIFWRKIVIFLTKYPKKTFKYAPLTWNPGSAPVLYIHTMMSDFQTHLKILSLMVALFLNIYFAWWKCITLPLFVLNFMKIDIQV